MSDRSWGFATRAVHAGGGRVKVVITCSFLARGGSACLGYNSSLTSPSLR